MSSIQVVNRLMETFISTASKVSGRCSSGAHKGTYHKMSKKHLGHSVSEFAGWHILRELDTVRQMEFIAAGFIGKRLMNEELACGVDGRLH